MIFELKANQYDKVRPLIQELKHNLVIWSILDGNTRGRVYSDDLVEPRRALVWNEMDTLLLEGDAQNEEFNLAIHELIGETLLPEAQERGIPQFNLSYAPADWEAKMGVVLQGLQAQRLTQRYFHFEGLRYDWRAHLPPGAALRKMDQQLLTNTSLQNYAQMMGWVRSFWGDPHDFTRKGIGYCLLEGEAAASWCLSVYVSDKHFEFGVATSPTYQNRGYATLAAAACMEYCVNNQITPHWQCSAGNQASLAVADKVGFRPAGEYPVYRIEIPPSME